MSNELKTYQFASSSTWKLVFACLLFVPTCDGWLSCGKPIAVRIVDLGRDIARNYTGGNHANTEGTQPSDP